MREQRPFVLFGCNLALPLGCNLTASLGNWFISTRLSHNTGLYLYVKQLTKPLGDLLSGEKGYVDSERVIGIRNSGLMEIKRLTQPCENLVGQTGRRTS